MGNDGHGPTATPRPCPPSARLFADSSTVHRPDMQSQALGLAAASGAVWLPSMVRVCRLSHSLGSTLAPMAAGPARFPDCCGDGIGGGGREKTMRLRRTAKPVIEVRNIPAEELRRTSKAGQASPIRRWSGCPKKPQTERVASVLHEY